MTSRHAFGGPRRLLLLACAGILGWIATAPAVGLGASPQAVVTFHSGPVGVIKDDVLRVNVTNLNATTQQAQIQVVDEKGSTHGITNFTLPAGQTGFFDVPFSGIVGRLMVRARTQCTNNLFLVSTEIYDANTLQTNLTLSRNDIIFGDVAQFAAVGITETETARLAVANLGATTAQFTLEFMEKDGTVIESAILSVPPKQIGFLDHDGNGVLGRKVLRATGGAGAGKAEMSVEVFDTLTGRTRYIEQDNLID